LFARSIPTPKEHGGGQRRGQAASHSTAAPPLPCCGRNAMLGTNLSRIEIMSEQAKLMRATAVAKNPQARRARTLVGPASARRPMTAKRGDHPGSIFLISGAPWAAATTVGLGWLWSSHSACPGVTPAMANCSDGPGRLATRRRQKAGYLAIDVIDNEALRRNGGAAPIQRGVDPLAGMRAGGRTSRQTVTVRKMAD